MLLKRAWIVLVAGFGAITVMVVTLPNPQPTFYYTYDPSAQICVGYSDTAEGHAAQDRCVVDGGLGK